MLFNDYTADIELAVQSKSAIVEALENASWSHYKESERLVNAIDKDISALKVDNLKLVTQDHQEDIVNDQLFMEVVIYLKRV